MQQRMIEVKWALIFVGVMLLWMALERAVGLHDQHIDKHMMLTNLFAIPAIAVYVFALREKRTRYYKCAMTYRQGFVSGLIMSLMIMLMSPMVQWVISTVISPHYFANVIEYSLATGFHQSREAAEAYFSLENYMFQSAVGALIMGLLTSAIVAFFLRAKSDQ